MQPLAAKAGVGAQGRLRFPRSPTAAAFTVPSPTATWREVAAAVAHPAPLPHHLSPAEQVVLVQVCEGLSNREIAALLGKSERTVKNQVSAILTKCGVSTRARLMATLRRPLSLPMTVRVATPVRDFT